MMLTATNGLCINLSDQRQVGMSRREDYDDDGARIFVGWQLRFNNAGNETCILLSDEAVSAIDELRSEVLHAIRCNSTNWLVDALNPPRDAEPTDGE